MSANRRSFLSAGLAAACGVGMASAADPVAENPNAVPAVDGLPCLDYGRSFICNLADFNRVRFWVESRTVLIDGDKQLEFYQCGSCKSENTFAEKDLFLADNYDFLPILGDGHWLVFRRKASLNPAYRTVKPTADLWGEPVLKLRWASKPVALDTWETIRDVTATATPIVARTELTDAQTGLKAIIECPVKTMNISIDKSLYQVDTGPVALPDLSRRFEPAIDCLRLAFVAFNAPDFADFVVEQPTPVVEGDEVRCQVHHYSQPFSLPARNTLLALEGA
jgi:hypothetical protein